MGSGKRGTRRCGLSTTGPGAPEEPVVGENHGTRDRGREPARTGGLASAYRLTALETAAGVVVGTERRPGLLPASVAPLEALERAVLPALERGPCLVSFSGGRDSSAVLAVAARVARQEGLPAPVPATIRFRDAERTVESEWQERVVADLALDDWMRIEVGDELDCIGPLARHVLSRHGLLWPPNAHFHLPLLEAAGGGSLLTGVGGDEVLGRSRWARVEAVLAGTVRPGPRDALRLALAVAPQPLRRAVLRRRYDVPFPWLRPDALRAVTDALVRDAAAEPAGWAARVAWRLRLRYVRVGIASLRLLADDAGVHLSHPLADPGFSAALASLPRDRRFGSRGEAMRALFAELLPPELADRTGKAGFGQAAFGPYSRAFVEGWDGQGVDPELVDADALARVWPQAEQDGRLLTVLQSAWLASPRRRVETQPDRRDG